MGPGSGPVQGALHIPCSFLLTSSFQVPDGNLRTKLPPLGCFWKGREEDICVVSRNLLSVHQRCWANAKTPPPARRPQPQIVSSGETGGFGGSEDQRGSWEPHSE